MGYWPDVKKGDKVDRPAGLENDLRHLVNHLDGFAGGSMTGRHPGDELTIQVYNSGATVLSAGQAVMMVNSGTSANGIIPVVAYSSGSPVWGVLKQTISSGQVAGCVIGGVVTVSCSRGYPDGQYMIPIQGGGYSRSLSAGNGAARVLFASDTLGNIAIYLGHGGGSSSSYTGYFMLRDASVYTSGSLTTAQVAVVDGVDVSGAYAGVTNIGEVSGGTFSIASSGATCFYVYGKWCEENCGDPVIFAIPGSYTSRQNLVYLGSATISSGAVVIRQSYSSGFTPMSFALPGNGWFRILDASTYTSAGELTTAKVMVLDATDVSGGYAGSSNLGPISGATISWESGAMYIAAYGYSRAGMPSADLKILSAPTSIGGGQVVELGRVQISSGGMSIYQYVSSRTISFSTPTVMSGRFAIIDQSTYDSNGNVQNGKVTVSGGWTDLGQISTAKDFTVESGATLNVYAVAHYLSGGALSGTSAVYEVSLSDSMPTEPRYGYIPIGEAYIVESRTAKGGVSSSCKVVNVKRHTDYPKFAEEYYV